MTETLLYSVRMRCKNTMLQEVVLSFVGQADCIEGAINAAVAAAKGMFGHEVSSDAILSVELLEDAVLW